MPATKSLVVAGCRRGYSGLMLPRVSALVCTRHRPESLAQTVHTLLLDPVLPHEVVVIDQSDDLSSRDLVMSISDPRIRYVRSKATGKGAALNEGLRVATGEFVLCTDDDCEVNPTWVFGMARSLADYPDVALVFSKVTAPQHDRAAGYVPDYLGTGVRVLRGPIDLCFGAGIGAGMALRRSVVLAIGGCDEAMGPGGRFPSADDMDLALRIIRHGWLVMDNLEISVLHHGFRTTQEGREHTRRDWVALGATCAKSIRGMYFAGAIPTAWLFVCRGLGQPIQQLARLRRPTGYVRIESFLVGFVGGLRTEVDRQWLVFKEAKARSVP